ncbi:hypothetical protein AVEN_110753-1 [Araneus ventricosus]|uniref:Uncharacterized protein n=1 Tax=Araneus ventricosus TaxID=182803 RepID=A0A4Y2S2H5_ARAVE|nr:hypothetical protein AVEN_110753-1 [Araneus ventricosus]
MICLNGWAKKWNGMECGICVEWSGHERLAEKEAKNNDMNYLTDEVSTTSPRKPFRKPFPQKLTYLDEKFNPCHGNLCDNLLPLPTTRFPKPFGQAFFAIWDMLYQQKFHPCSRVLTTAVPVNNQDALFPSSTEWLTVSLGRGTSVVNWS